MKEDGYLDGVRPLFLCEIEKIFPVQGYKVQISAYIVNADMFLKFELFCEVVLSRIFMSAGGGASAAVRRALPC